MIQLDWKTFWIILAIAWSLPWKSWGLWRAARNKQKIWFTAMIIIQSIGILPILYLFFFQKNKNNKKSKILKRLHSTKTYEIFKTRKGFRKGKSRKTN